MAYNPIYTALSLQYAVIAGNNSADEDSVALWYIRGVAGYWPTKMCAEMIAANHFPDESAEQRYGRIFYRTFER